MRTRPLVLSLLLTTSSAFLLAGCSGKPENSPAIRQKFAQFDQSEKNVEQLALDVQGLKDQVAQLTQENSELRALAPTANAAPAGKTKGAAATDVQASAGKSKGAEAKVSPEAAAPTKPTNLEEASLAGASPADEKMEKKPGTTTTTTTTTTTGAKSVLAQQQVTKATDKKLAAKSGSNSFKAMTSGSAKNAVKPVSKDAAAPAAAKDATTPATKEVATPATAVKSTPAKSGNWHTIASGDTLASISSKYGISSDALVKANHVPAGAQLALGQKLYIPK